MSQQFDENGKYIKTDWKAGDKITATKLNKIEESIEAISNTIEGELDSINTQLEYIMNLISQIIAESKY